MGAGTGFGKRNGNRIHQNLSGYKTESVSDLYDLLDKLKEDALAQFDELLAGIEKRGVESTILDILLALKNNVQAFHLIGGGGDFTHRVVQRCYRYMGLHLLVSPALGWDEAQKGMAYAFLNGGVGSVIECWMQGECKETPEQVAAAILELSKIVATGLTGK